MSTARKLAQVRSKLAELTLLVAELEEAEQKQSCPIWVETGEAAESLGVALDTVRSLCRRKGYGRRSGGRWQVDLAALREYFRRT
ncbi:MULTISPECIES: helix-turn-helix domain-containing protein [Mesorhizobium]|uniref:helix-turn-helix domain-containing protein n=1 Tax=Mesorhizobium TaxID=68287 RepID=UPI0012EC7976|nr:MULTISPECIES: helix-turn-helix domain-containing protein [Mesorhizobium]WJI40283.1 helix-turn-helix domain-containing protein [Mesorhizobium opportunistum]